MTLLEIILISIGLAMDASAVSMAAAAAGFAKERGQVFRLALFFGLFQGLMPVLGWLIGATFVELIQHWDHWIAFLLLGFVGGRMIYEGLDKNPEQMKSDPTRGWTLITLSIATSIDALAVGLSFSLLDVAILVPALLIGIITAVMVVLATQLGKVAGKILGKRVEILGGIILLGIGLRIVISHTI